jgi:undecaprenyl-diphosphatase
MSAEANSLNALLLGIIQGITEFLPVSSSGHLVLFTQFFPAGGDEVFFDLIVHVGTLIPILWFYREDLKRMVLDVLPGANTPYLSRDGVKLLLMLVAASIPTAIIGLLFEDLFEQMFSTPAVLVGSFSFTGALLYTTRFRSGGATDLQDFSVKQALLLGLAQGIAITPGISRSGTTIATGLMLGLQREFAARFSFLMSVPAICGAVLLKSRDLQADSLVLGPSIIGGLAAMVVGYLSLVFLVRIVKKGGLQHFAWYCWAMAVASLIIALL